jgi:hypothetical protein
MRGRRVRSALLVLALGALGALGACGDDQDPEGARVLWAALHGEDPYRSWATAPGYFARQPSDTAHGTSTQIFVNAILQAGLEGDAPLAEWPAGSIIVKDGYEGGHLYAVAAMEKRANGWFWAEWNTRGESIYSGRPDLCISCHERGQDLVRAFPLP